MAILALKPERLDAGEFNDQPVSICGKAFRADYSGALYWPAEDALIVADLHLEKGSSFAAKGIMLPPYDTRETLTRLAEAMDRFNPQTIIALGDSLHDAAGASRLTPEDRESLKILQDDREWIWITGNHDPKIARELGGHVLDNLTVEGLTFRHEPSNGRVTHEIAAHLHPAAKLSLHGYSFRRPCFVSNGLRLVMPAFGTYAGGLNILDDAFDPLFGSDGMSVWMLGQEGLYPVAPRLLRPD
ncbi:MAG: phosphoesterase [Hyphomicrobium sp.]|jgi:DNA ligase-associated metallophosphoesterase|nr:phosphoesterase [Hyphomicrobium sp.]PPD06005.1 MAG: phosphoesterase [Hyphomicrobium sp.]